MAYELIGNWKKGRAFDLHTISSSYLGADEFGHDRFDNTRSEMGELLYLMKYRQDPSVAEKIVSLLDSIGGIEKFDFLIPIPPTNKNRKIQPVEVIADLLGKRRGVQVLRDCLTNDGNEELKGITDPVARIELLEKVIALATPNLVSGKSVLLIDDLYRSGATLHAATDLLLRQGKAAMVCVLTMTKTRSNR